MAKKTGLGKGLSALLESTSTDMASFEGTVPLGRVAEVSINDIEANPFQPRTEFDPTLLNELADSIRVHGVIQPITVRWLGYGKYQIISGERRTKASILAGLTTIPAYVRVANDQEMLEMALIENIQRKDLNPVEIALSYKRLLDECKLKQEELGERVGKDRTTVNNYLRLLKLPDVIQAALREEKISMGHARALITIESPEQMLQLFHEMLSQHLSVRSVEEKVRQTKETGQVPTEGQRPISFIDEFETYQHTLGQRYNSKIQFRAKGDRGEIVIPFRGKSELERLIALLEGS